MQKEDPRSILELLTSARGLERIFIEQSPNLILLKDSALRIIYANQEYRKNFPIHDWEGKTPEELFPPEVASDMREKDEAALAAGSVAYEESWTDMTGRTRRFYTQKFRIGEPGPQAFLGAIITDITALTEAETELEKSRARYRTLFDMESDAIVMIENSTGRILEANAATASLYGYPLETILSLRNSDLSAEPEETTRVTTENPPLPDKILFIPLRWHKKADGTVFPVEITGRFFLLGDRAVHIAAIRDITERRKAEEEKIAMERRLLQAQKLDAIGFLAGGIAHDFNNFLAGIFGNVQLAQSYLSGTEDPRIAQALDSCLSSFSRAKSLTHQLLTFSRGGAPLRKRGSLESLIRDSARFAMSGSSHSALVSVEEGLSECEFDEGQIGQVIDNLIINAQQAMPEGGTIRVEARNLSVPPPGRGPLKPGTYVEVRISDTGTGFGPEAQTHLFEPFFTTKSAGSGLGLPTSRSIIQKHGGNIEIESSPGKGSTVTFVLPALGHGGSEASPMEEPSGEGERGSPARSASILVMDDEEPIRNILSLMLPDLGYRVVACPDGGSALAEFRAAKEGGSPFDAIILDLTIPSGLGGREVIAEIRSVDPDVPVIASSGYSQDPIMSEPTAWGFSAALPKPYLRDGLSRLLARLLSPARR